VAVHSFGAALGRNAMTADDIEEMAQRLTDLRRTERVSAGLGDLAPQTLADAYRIQDRFREVWGQPVAGWKVGATTAPVQARFGVTEPFTGPFFADDTYRSPAELAARSFAHLCIETEFAFRFTRPLAPRPSGYTRTEILAAIDAVIPAFELVSPRFDRILFEEPFSAIADCALNGGFVLGRPVAEWSGIDFVAHAVTLMVNGNQIADGTGANVLGHPFAVLDWTVDHLGRRGIGLEAGVIVSTGTVTGLTFLEPGQTAVADFGSLGQVEVTFR
jgi:2-keto-4-pentenoate hydratase